MKLPKRKKRRKKKVYYDPLFVNFILFKMTQQSMILHVVNNVMLQINNNQIIIINDNLLIYLALEYKRQIFVFILNIAIS